MKTARKKVTIIGLATLFATLFTISITKDSSLVTDTAPESRLDNNTPSDSHHNYASTTTNNNNAAKSSPMTKYTPAKTQANLAAGGLSPFGVPSIELAKQLCSLALTTPPGSIRINTLRREVESFGITTRQDESPAGETGKRTVISEHHPHRGVFNLSIQATEANTPNEKLEGFRFSLLPTDKGVAELIASIEGQIDEHWKLTYSTETTRTWEHKDGFTLWVRHYTTEDPSPLPGPKQTIRFGLEVAIEF